MSNTWFQFKQFLVTQEKSALKVGTDGVLLGAWCSVQGAKSMEHGARSKEQGAWGMDHGGEIQGKAERILDVGTGTGLIALMLAQRSEAAIHAVEISEEACADALNNFQHSPWNNRLKLFPIDFNQFCGEISCCYDLVVCNPPFFSKSLKSADRASSVARHDVSLSFLQLISGAKKILADTGRLAVIVPVEAFDDFRETARLNGFYLSRKTLVIPLTGRLPKRVLLEFSVKAVYPVVDELVILLEKNKYSEEYKELTKEFYLNCT